MHDIIHIGYPKTATTWFQNELFPYVTNKYYVPRTFIKSNIYGKTVFEYNGYEVKQKIKHPFLLSFEGLSGNVHNYGLNGYMIKEFANRLFELSPNAVVVLFIRNQYDIIASSYLQYVKNGGTYGIKNYLHHPGFDDPRDSFLFSFDYFKYDKIIRLYVDLFGKTNVKVYLYEDFNTLGKVFVKKFIKDLELDVDLEKINLDRVNYAYRNRTRKIARIFNLFSKEGMVFKYYLMHIPGWYVFSKKLLFRFNQKLDYNIVSSSKLLNKKDILFIKRFYSQSNQILINEYQLEGIKKYNYPLG